MKKVLYFSLTALLILTVALSGCGGGGGKGGGGNDGGGNTLSGTVTNSANGLGIKNVTLSIGGTIVTTDVNGKWSVKNPTYPVIVTVTTSNVGWTFDRTSVNVPAAASDVNFTVTFAGIQETIILFDNLNSNLIEGPGYDYIVVVPPGIYNLTSNLLLLYEDIHLKSTDPDDPAVVAATIINGYGITIHTTPSRSIVEGFTIRGGSGANDSGISVQGGGIATIRKNIIENCGKHGVEIFSVTSSIEISNNIIRNNSVNSASGNGIFMTVNASASIVITGNEISGNKKGICLSSSVSGMPVTINNNTITGNNSGSSGAGILFQGCNVTMNGNTISNNAATAGNGGGLSASSSTITMSNNTFSNNSATVNGGAISLAEASTATITNTLFSGNTASTGKVAYCANDSNLTMGAGNTYSNGNSNSASDIYYQP